MNNIENFTRIFICDLIAGTEIFHEDRRGNVNRGGFVESVRTEANLTAVITSVDGNGQMRSEFVRVNLSTVLVKKA